MSKVQGWIYKITNTVNGKIYVGQTTNLTKRINDHKSKLKTDNHRNKHLQLAWNKYGSDSFKYEIIEQFDVEMNFDIDNLERFWIKKLESMNPDKGYNKESGGNTQKSLSDETKKKLSQINKRKAAEMTVEERKLRFGHPISEEQRKAHSELMKGRKSWNKGLRGIHIAWNKGITCSSDTKLKMSQAKLGKPRNNKGYSKFKVVLTNLENAERIIFDSVYKCAEAIGASYSTIKNHIKRESKLLMKKYQIRNLTSEVSN